MGGCCETKGRHDGILTQQISLQESKEIRTLYEQQKQGHVFSFFNQLEFIDQQALLKEAISVDLQLINQLFAELVGFDEESPIKGYSTPSFRTSATVSFSNQRKVEDFKKEKPEPKLSAISKDIVTQKDQLSVEQKTEMINLGNEMIRDGMVAVIVMAGGQGSRLGFDRSKGEYPLNLPSMKTLFQILAEKFIKAQMNAHNSSEITDDIQNCKFIVMTSPMNHEETKQYFEFNSYFGLRKDTILFFEQSILPIVNYDGKIIMDEPNKIALAPNGNGGIYDAINNNYRVKEVIDSVDYVQIVHVDNVLNKILDPLMIGYTASKELYLCMKGCKKRSSNPLQGVFVQKDYRYGVVDYDEVYDIPEIKKEAIENINIFMIKADKLSEICSNAENLSYNYHKSYHRHAYWDFKKMKLRKPETPNAYRFELNLVDMLDFVEADKFGILVVPRDDEYSPIIFADNVKKAAAAIVKSKTILTSPTLRPPRDASPSIDAFSDNGSTTSTQGPYFNETPITARDMIFKQSARWLRDAGAVLTNEFPHIEVDTLLSYEGEGLRELVEGRKMPPPSYIKRGTFKIVQ